MDKAGDTAIGGLDIREVDKKEGDFASRAEIPVVGRYKPGQLEWICCFCLYGYFWTNYR